MKVDAKTVGVHCAETGSFAERWAEALDKRGARVRRIDLLGADPLKQVAGCDGVMWHWPHYPHEVRMAALPILRVIAEHLRIPVFPDLATCWHYDDKIAQSVLLDALEIPIPKTWVFWRKPEALAWCAKAEFPVVAKSSAGASSQSVCLIRTGAEARAYVERCFSGSGILFAPPLPHARLPRWRRRLGNAAKRLWPAAAYALANRYPDFPDPAFWMPHKNYALFQEFLPDNEYDTRVTVIGNRAFAFRRFNRPNDFRASGSGRIDHDPAAIDGRCLRAAFAAARKLGSQSMAFDFLFRGRNGAPVVGEISYCYADWAVERCPGHWDSELNWHAGHLWPETAHVEDFLKRVEARG